MARHKFHHHHSKSSILKPLIAGAVVGSILSSPKEEEIRETSGILASSDWGIVCQMIGLFIVGGILIYIFGKKY